MKTSESGNGVKVAKVVSEVNEVLNSNISATKKVVLLCKIETTGRPGAAIARELIDKFTGNYYEKYRNYLSGRLVKMDVCRMLKHEVRKPRGYNFMPDKPTWIVRFIDHLSSIAGKANLYDVQNRANIEELKFYGIKHSGLTAKKYDKELTFAAREIAQEAEEVQRARDKFIEDTGLPLRFMGHETPLSLFTKNKSERFYTKVSDCYVVREETITEDWDKYSKSWHGKYGAAVSVDDRRIVFYKAGAGKVGSVSVDRWTQANVINGIAEFFGNKPKKARKAVQLNDNLECVLTKSLNDYEIYERRLAGALLDYAIYDKKNKVAYHNEDKGVLVDGLKQKIEAKAEKEYKLITKETGFALKFCQTGMRNFCADNDLDFEGEYRLNELRNIVLQKRELNKTKYGYELAKIGIKIK